TSVYSLKIDTKRRKFIERNHTATHLLHSALREVLGEHVHQEGSYVESDKLRFDFTHFKSLSSEELITIEKRINEIIFRGLNVKTEISDYDKAVKDGAMALFNEKYDDQVKIVSIENVSKELCGGTHIKNTAEIGMFKIISESSIASGIRRIEAISSGALYNTVSDMYSSLHSINEILKVTSVKDAENKINQLIDNDKIAKKQMKNTVSSKVDMYIDKLKKQSFEDNSITYIISVINDNNIKNAELRLLMDGIKASYKKTAGIICSVSENKLFIITFSSNTSYDAGKIMKKINEITNGKGGGRKEMALGSAMVPKDITLFEKQIKDIILDE
ncbi:alanine--tRNA ligase, partial [candidate division WOR-3 bacterium]|nr:alanine--tRNA ligase [candidate division WOR-3 bacterium]